MQSGDSDASPSSSQNLPDSFKDLRITQVWRPQSCCQISGLMRHKTYAQKIRKRRKPVLIKYKPRMQKVPEYNHPMPSQYVQKITIPNLDSSPEEHVVTHLTKFQKREITTIKEEVFQYSKRSYKNRISKNKGYQEKVASLKVIVGRLQKMCLEKPEVLQNNIPDETIMLFKAIHI